MLAGCSGQISLGHGALMAVGAYTVALLIGNEGWALVPGAGRVGGGHSGRRVPVGAAASRLRGPYLAGATLAFAVGLPALADKFPATFGGENGLMINPPVPPSSLGVNFPLERWEAWIACAGALIVMFVLYNLIHSGFGRSMRRYATTRSRPRCAACASGARRRSRSSSAPRARGSAAVCWRRPAARQPGAFPLQLSLSLLTGVVLGGLGSLVGAIWGAALLVLLPELDQRPRQLVLALDEGLGQPAAGDLRPGADRRDARLAERDPGRGPGLDPVAAGGPCAAGPIAGAAVDAGEPTARAGG